MIDTEDIGASGEFFSGGVALALPGHRPTAAKFSQEIDKFRLVS